MCPTFVRNVIHPGIFIIHFMVRYRPWGGTLGNNHNHRRSKGRTWATEDELSKRGPVGCTGTRTTTWSGNPIPKRRSPIPILRGPCFVSSDKKKYL